MRAAVAYVAGMTDRFAFRHAVAVLGWDPAKLPRGGGRVSGAGGPTRGQRSESSRAVDPRRAELGQMRSARASKATPASPAGSDTITGTPSSPPSRRAGMSGI